MKFPRAFSVRLKWGEISRELVFWKVIAFTSIPRRKGSKTTDNESFDLIWQRLKLYFNLMSECHRAGDNNLIKAIYNRGSDITRDLHTVQQIQWFTGDSVHTMV